MAVSDHIRDPKSTRGLEVTAPSGGLSRGAFVLVGDTWGIVYQALLVGIAGIMHYMCHKILVPKSTGSGNDIALGVDLFLNVTTKVVSDTQSSGDLFVGTCIKAATTADTTVMADLDGRMG